MDNNPEQLLSSTLVSWLDEKAEPPIDANIVQSEKSRLVILLLLKAFSPMLTSAEQFDRFNVSIWFDENAEFPINFIKEQFDKSNEDMELEEMPLRQ